MLKNKLLSLALLAALSLSTSTVALADIFCPQTVTCKSASFYSCSMDNGSREDWRPVDYPFAGAGTYQFYAAFGTELQAKTPSKYAPCVYVKQSNNALLHLSLGKVVYADTNQPSTLWKQLSGSTMQCWVNGPTTPPSKCPLTLTPTAAPK